MTIEIIDKTGSLIANALEFDAVVSSGLLGLYFPVGALADIGHNFAPNGADATIVGSPAAADGGVRLNSTAYLDTGLSETAAFTYIVIGKTPDDGSAASKRPYYIGTYGSANEAGISGSGGGTVIGIGSAATTLIGNASHFNDAGSTTLTSGNRTVTMASGALNAWKMMALTANDSTNKLWQMTDGLASLDTTYSYARTKSTGKIRIGTTYSANGLGNADVACAAIYNRVLSDTELAQARAQFAAVVAPYIGLTV